MLYLMTKYTCHYCACASSPQNLLRILTLPDRDTVIHACEMCFLSDYQFDREAKQTVLTAEIMLAGAVGDEAAVTARIGATRVSSAASMFLL